MVVQNGQLSNYLALLIAAAAAGFATGPAQ